MQLFLILLLSVIGLFLIAKGGDIFTSKAIVIAKKLKMPPILIGATIVSVGTTLPEILVSSLAAANGDVGLAVSNATGSMLCNLTLILGLALSCGSVICARKTYLEKLIFSGINIVLLTVFMIDVNISLIESILLLVLFVSFMVSNIISGKRGAKAPNFSAPEEKQTEEFSIFTVLFFLVGGLALALGAELLVTNISKLATVYLKIPTIIVGATVVALGTSLPELVTAINAVKKKNVEMSIGNVLGANIINGTFIVGLSGVLQGGKGMQVVTEGAGGSLAIVISVIIIFIGILILGLPILIKQKTYRWQGFSFLALYTAYIAYIITSTVAQGFCGI